jgi:hypothetical protein
MEADSSGHYSLHLQDRMIELTDEELSLRLDNFEDHFVERKSSGDSKDWLKTAVAFANSVPIGYPAILFVGVKNTGEIEGDVNLDTLQKTFGRLLADAYPTIYYTSKVVSRGGKQCLAVIIPGSSLRPHFAGQSYIREGSQTKKSSEAQFAKMISERNSKAYEISKWTGKKITFQFPPIETLFSGTSTRRSGDRVEATVTTCNQFYVTVQWLRFGTDLVSYSCPLKFVEISFDNPKQSLELIVTRHTN